MLHFTDKELLFQCRVSEWCEYDGVPTYTFTSENSYAFYSSTVSNLVAGRHVLYRARRQPELEVMTNNTAGHRSVGSFDTAENVHSVGSLAFLERLYNTSANAPVTMDFKAPIKFGQFWSGIVSQYSDLKLTLNGDILPALFGIANLVAQHRPGRYLAGIWERDIHFLLSWKSLRDEGRCYRPRVPTAPSWSWASRIGPIHFPFQVTITYICTILNAKCDIVGSDPFGQVRGGYLIVRGKLVSREVLGIQEDYPGTFDRYICFWETQGLEDETETRKHQGYISLDTEDDEAELQFLENGTKIHFLEISRTVDDDCSEEEVEDNTCLVLREDLKTRTYKRIGMGYPKSSSAFKLVPDSIGTIT